MGPVVKFGKSKLWIQVQSFTLTLTLALSSTAQAVSSSQSMEERVTFPQGREIYIKPTGSQQEVGFVSNDQRFRLFTAERILTVPQFTDSKGYFNRSLGIYNAGDAASSWFFAMTEDGLQFVLKVPSDSSPFVSFLVPIKSVSIQKFSQSVKRLANGDLLVLVSYANTKGEKGTVLVRTHSNASAGDVGKYNQYEVAMVNNEFSHFEEAKKQGVELYTVNGNELVFGKTKLDLNQLNGSNRAWTARAALIEDTNKSEAKKIGSFSFTDKLKGGIDAIRAQVAAQAQSPIESHREQAQRLAEAAILAQNSRETSAQTSEPYKPAALPQSAHAQVQTQRAEVSQGELDSQRREFEYKNQKFILYNTQTQNSTGSYIQRVADKVTVHIATKMANVNEFTFEDGILSHSELARKVDLEANAFSMEATFRPRMASEEVAWLDKEFQSYRQQGTTVMSAIDARKPLVENLVKQLLKASRSSSILLGEAGDKKIIISEVAESLPRTWRINELDPGVLGTDIGIVGEFEKKVRKIVEAQKTVPVIWISENFENLKGLGAAGDSKRDFLDLISREMGENGSFKVIGTSYSSQDLLGAVKNPTVLQSLQLKDVENLTDAQVRTYLEKWLAQHPDMPQVSGEILQAVQEVGQDFRPIDPEPQRSLDLLEVHLSKVVDEKKPELANNKVQLNKTASEFYRMDPALRDRAQQRARLTTFNDSLESRIIGHDHFKKEAYQATKIALAGLAGERGPRATFYLDGPPGTGKTESAIAYAEALGLPFVRIEMNQYKPGSGNGINELMSVIGKALKVNPYTVILLDELDKSDYGVQEGLLAMMDNKVFTYYEEQGSGPKRAVRSSAQNATLFAAANAIGDMAREFFYSIPYEERENLTSEQLTERFYKQYSKESVEETQVNKIARPLLDRFKKRLIMFPPTSKGFTQILNMKVKGVQKLAMKRYKAKITFTNQKPYVEQMVKTALENNWSSRELIAAVETHVASAASEINFLEDYRENSTYLVDLKDGHVVRGDVIQIFKKPAENAGVPVSCKAAVGSAK